MKNVYTMERFDLNIWTHILLSCESDKDYVNGLALVPHKRYRDYLLNDKVARQKRVERFTTHEVRFVRYGPRERRVDCWYYKGKLHREGDLPALIYEDGSRMWYFHGMLHRENDLPAIEYSGGSKEWYRMDKLSREGGKPNAVLGDGSKYWYDENTGRLTKFINPSGLASFVATD